MTDETMPRELYATPRGSGTLSGVYVDMPLGDEERGEHKYIHHTTHEAALQALEVARDVLSYYNEYDQNNGYRARQALKQINAIWGGE